MNRILRAIYTVNVLSGWAFSIVFSEELRGVCFGLSAVINMLALMHEKETRP